MRKAILAFGLLALTSVTASAQWQLGPSMHEPCWSIANPVRCDGRYRPENPLAHELFKRDPGTAVVLA